MSTTATITTDVVTSKDPSFTAIIKELRDRSLRPRKVRALVGDLTAKLATLAIETPAPDEKVAVIVILRSGLVMAEPFLSQLPETADTVIYHLGLFREKQTLQPVEYYNKLPAKSPRIRHAYVLDPVLATGGTAEAAVAILK
jgi:uracil phosphoribosyltransferase